MVYVTFQESTLVLLFIILLQIRKVTLQFLGDLAWNDPISITKKFYMVYVTFQESTLVLLFIILLQIRN